MSVLLTFYKDNEYLYNYLVLKLFLIYDDPLESSILGITEVTDYIEWTALFIKFLCYLFVIGFFSFVFLFPRLLFS